MQNALASRDPALPSLRALRRLLAQWRARRQSRASLGRLDPRLLRDIGIDPWQAAQEAARPFWKA